MSISAINNTVFKSQTSFGYSERNNFNEISDVTDRLNETLVKSSDIKSPAAVGASIALAALTVGAGAKGVTLAVTSEKLAPNLGVKVETGLKSAANKVKTKANDWEKVNPDNISSKVKKYTGKVLGKIEEGTRNVYKSIAYMGIPKEAVNPEKANKALSNAVGVGMGTAAVVDICSTDANGDGITDIMQKSQNVYTGAKTNYDSAIQTVGILSELAQVLA